MARTKDGVRTIRTASEDKAPLKRTAVRLAPFGAVSHRRPLSARKRFVFSAVLAVIVGSVCFVVGEIACRLLPVAAGYEQMRLRRDFFLSTKTHAKWGWAFQPDADVMWNYAGREKVAPQVHFKTIPIPNHPDYGFRDDGIAYPGRTFLVLGDSFTFGATVELDDVWCEVLEQEHPGVDFINAAMGGGVVKAFLQYEDIGDDVPHDVVIYQLWLGNEFIDNRVDTGKEGWNTKRATANNLHQYDDIYPPTLFRPLAERSKLAWSLQFLWRTLRNNRESTARSQPANSYLPEADQVWDDRVGNLWVKPRNDICLNYARDLSENDELLRGVANTGEYLRRLDELAQHRGKSLLVIIFPFKEQVYFELLAEHLGDESLDPLRPNQIVTEFCQQHGIKYFDTTSSIVAERDQKLYWDYDPHFTKIGQRVAAKTVRQYLTRERLLTGKRDAERNNNRAVSIRNE